MFYGSGYRRRRPRSSSEIQKNQLDVHQNIVDVRRVREISVAQGYFLGGRGHGHRKDKIRYRENRFPFQF